MRILSIIRIIGILVMCFSGTMLVPAFVALIYGDGGGKAFMQAFMLSLTAGTLLWWPCHHHKQELRSRDGFLIVVAFWLVLGSLATLPLLLFDSPHLTIASAVFEAFSGLTTTGATVMTGLDNLPKSILFYRQFLQWLGGMGIIVLAVAIIPLLGIGGTQLYRAESSGPLKDQKSLPKISEVAKALWIIYASLTVLCAIAYWLSGMNLFDAIGHSFSTISNGGFSTHDASIGYFNQASIYWVTTIFMLIGGVNFSLHISAFLALGKRNIWRNYWKDPEFRFFLTMQIIFIGIVSLSLYGYGLVSDINEAVTKGALQLTSMSMTAGYTIFDIDNLPPFIGLLLVISAVIGGCGGSTTGGLKAIRTLILWKQIDRELHSLIHPNLVQPIRIGKNRLAPRMIESIWAFFIIFILVYWGCVFAVILCGMNTFDAMGAVFATLTNAGPGLGFIHESFIGVPESAKLVFSFAMICGRLEMFSLIVLFIPSFWKK
ncbi:TrkH family potassium uptake protein [Haemophilus influenzae]|nr:TrkH family potassium uptake protein [Haemophilus influenzae]